MKNNILFLICMLLCPLGKTFARVETPEWQSQYAIGLNKLAPHAYVWPYKEGWAQVSPLSRKPCNI